MEKLFRIEEKRELCRMISDAYKQRAKDNLDASMESPGKISRTFKDGNAAAYIGGLSFLGFAMFGCEDEKQAKKYEKLATSKLLYFKTEASLQKTLKELPGKKKFLCLYD